MARNTPSLPQGAALNMARVVGYVRPASPAHAKRLDTTCLALARTVRSCERRGWLRHDLGGRYHLTEAGAVFFESSIEGW